MNGPLETIHILRQGKNWLGRSRKWPVFADVQYYIYADIVGLWVGGSETVQNYADIWMVSYTPICLHLCS